VTELTIHGVDLVCQEPALCWAACVKMVLAVDGIEVTQQGLHDQAFPGSRRNRAAYPDEVVRLLADPGIETSAGRRAFVATAYRIFGVDVGKRSGPSLVPIAASESMLEQDQLLARDLESELMQGRPFFLSVMDPGRSHAYLVTGMRYVPDARIHVRPSRAVRHFGAAVIDIASLFLYDPQTGEQFWRTVEDLDDSTHAILIRRSSE